MYIICHGFTIECDCGKDIQVGEEQFAGGEVGEWLYGPSTEDLEEAGWSVEGECPECKESVNENVDGGS